MDAAVKEQEAATGTGAKRVHHHCRPDAEFCLCGHPVAAGLMRAPEAKPRKPLCPECQFVMEQQGFKAADGCPT